MGKRVVLNLSLSERDDLCKIIARGDNWRARQRAQTLVYLDDGASLSEAAEMVGVNVRTVGTTRTAWLGSGKAGLYDAPRCGAPHKLTEHELQNIVALARAQPLTANALLARHLQSGGAPVHVATLTAALTAAGLVWKRTRASLKKKK
jgi:transposase